MRLVRLMAAGLVIGAVVGFAWALLRPRAPHGGNPRPTGGTDPGGDPAPAERHSGAGR